MPRHNLSARQTLISGLESYGIPNPSPTFHAFTRVSTSGFDAGRFARRRTCFPVTIEQYCLAKDVTKTWQYKLGHFSEPINTNGARMLPALGCHGSQPSASMAGHLGFAQHTGIPHLLRRVPAGANACFGKESKMFRNPNPLRQSRFRSQCVMQERRDTAVKDEGSRLESPSPQGQDPSTPRSTIHGSDLGCAKTRCGWTGVDGSTCDRDLLRRPCKYC